MSVRISRRLVLAAVITAALPLSACKDKDDDKKKKDDDDEEEEEEEEEEEDEDPMAGATYKTVPSTKVQVPIPKGWATKKKSLYSVASAPDGKAFLAFTTVSSRGEFVGRIQHVGKTFKITDYKKGKVTKADIGPDKLKAEIIDATCSFNDTAAIMSSVLVDYGKRRHVFVVYALDQSASETTKTQAQQAILRMRRSK
jgi:hypothetical protein